MMRRATVVAIALACAAPPAPAATYTLDPTHSFVYAEFDHFGTTASRVRIGPIDGEVELDRDAKRGAAVLRIATARLSSGVAALDSRLHERDLLATDEHPDAFFSAARFVFDGTTLREVHGELMLRGETKPVVLRARRFNCYTNPLFRREVCGGDFDAEIRRSEYGMTYLLPFIGDKVRLLISVEGIVR